MIALAIASEETIIDSTSNACQQTFLYGEINASSIDPL